MRVALGQFGVVGHHDDQPVVGDLLQHGHDLHAGLGIQSAGGLVGEQDLRVVDQGAGDRHPLHLPARELVGPFVDMVGQPDLGQRSQGPFAALGP